MTEHKISWLNMPGYKPETWNPIVGCTKVSPGCDNCYAERMAFRIAQMQLKNHGKNGYHYTEVSKLTSIGWTGETRFVSEVRNKPLEWKDPRIIFVCSMGDLFHESVPFTWIDNVIRKAAVVCPKHIFIILTKRPERMREYLYQNGADSGFYWNGKPIPNIWIGVTAENQEQANKRIPILLQIPAAKRFVSIEPMLGPVELTDIQENYMHQFLTGFFHCQGMNEPSQTNKLDWVICGGESGPKARPVHPDWVRFLRDQCHLADVPFFFKQWGEWMPTSRPLTSSEINVLPKHYASTGKFLQITDPWAEYYKAGKLKSGDKLDGLQHHEWPKINL